MLQSRSACPVEAGSGYIISRVGFLGTSAMTDWSGSLARAFASHLEIAGSSGSRAPITRNSSNRTSKYPGTVPPAPVVPGVSSPQWGDLGTLGTSHPEPPVPLASRRHALIFADSKHTGT